MIRNPKYPGYVGVHSATAHRYFSSLGHDGSPCQQCPTRCDHSCPCTHKDVRDNSHGQSGHPVWMKELDAIAATLEFGP